MNNNKEQQQQQQQNMISHSSPQRAVNPSSNISGNVNPHLALFDNNRNRQLGLSRSHHTASSNVIHALGPYDILFGRCKACFNNIGNRRFRVTIGMYLKRYMATKNRNEKSALFQSIVSSLQNDAGARFLKPIKGGGGYIELGVKQAREKIGHALRDLVMTKYQSTISELTQSQRNTKEAAAPADDVNAQIQQQKNTKKAAAHDDVDVQSQQEQKKKQTAEKESKTGQEDDSEDSNTKKKEPQQAATKPSITESSAPYLDEIEIIKKPVQDLDEESVCSSLDDASLRSVFTEVSKDLTDSCCNYDDMINMPMTI